jgi:hypothetical protein
MQASRILSSVHPNQLAYSAPRRQRGIDASRNIMCLRYLKRDSFFLPPVALVFLASSDIYLFLMYYLSFFVFILFCSPPSSETRTPVPIVSLKINNK